MLTIIRLSKRGEFRRTCGAIEFENEFEGVIGVRSISGELVLGALNMSSPSVGAPPSSVVVTGAVEGVLAEEKPPRPDEIRGESMESFGERSNTGWGPRSLHMSQLR